MSLICFVDNNSARDVAISGCGRNIIANTLIDFLLKLEMSACTACTTPWYSRVPTPLNFADDPSRGEIAMLLKQEGQQTFVQDDLRKILMALAETAVEGVPQLDTTILANIFLLATFFLICDLYDRCWTLDGIGTQVGVTQTCTAHRHWCGQKVRASFEVIHLCLHSFSTWSGLSFCCAVDVSFCGLVLA